MSDRQRFPLPSTSYQVAPLGASLGRRYLMDSSNHQNEPRPRPPSPPQSQENTRRRRRRHQPLPPPPRFEVRNGYLSSARWEVRRLLDSIRSPPATSPGENSQPQPLNQPPQGFLEPNIVREELHRFLTLRSYLDGMFSDNSGGSQSGGSSTRGMQSKRSVVMSTLEKSSEGSILNEPVPEDTGLDTTRTSWSMPLLLPQPPAPVDLQPDIDPHTGTSGSHQSSSGTTGTSLRSLTETDSEGTSSSDSGNSTSEEATSETRVSENGGDSNTCRDGCGENNGANRPLNGGDRGNIDRVLAIADDESSGNMADGENSLSQGAPPAESQKDEPSDTHHLDQLRVDIDLVDEDLLSVRREYQDMARQLDQVERAIAESHDILEKAETFYGEYEWNKDEKRQGKEKPKGALARFKRAFEWRKPKVKAKCKFTRTIESLFKRSHGE